MTDAFPVRTRALEQMKIQKSSMDIKNEFKEHKLTTVIN